MIAYRDIIELECITVNSLDASGFSRMQGIIRGDEMPHPDENTMQLPGTISNSISPYLPLAPSIISFRSARLIRV